MSETSIQASEQSQALAESSVFRDQQADNDFSDKMYQFGSPQYEDFVMQLEKFRPYKNGTYNYRNVRIGLVPINIYKLHLVVQKKGGIYKVNEQRKWKDISREFNIPLSYTNGSYLIKQLYFRTLYDFDMAHNKIPFIPSSTSSQFISPRTPSARGFISFSPNPSPSTPASLKKNPSRLSSSAKLFRSSLKSLASDDGSSGERSGSHHQTPSSYHQTPDPYYQALQGSESSLYEAFSKHHSPLKSNLFSPQQQSYPPHNIHQAYPPQRQQQPQQQASVNNDNFFKAHPQNYQSKQFINILKSLDLSCFQNGTSSRVFRALDSGLSNEIQWAFNQLLKFSFTFEYISFNLTGNPGSGPIGGNQQHEPGPGQSSLYFQQLGFAIKNILNSAILERLLVFAFPFYKIIESFKAFYQSNASLSKVEALDAFYGKELQRDFEVFLSSPSLYGINLESLSNSNSLSNSSCLSKGSYMRHSLLELFSQRALQVLHILHNFTFLSIDNIRTLTCLKPFQFVLSKSFLLIQTLAQIALCTHCPSPPQQKDTVLDIKTYEGFQSLFPASWIEISNLVLEILANVCPLISFEEFPDIDLVITISNLAFYCKDRYYVVIALECLCKFFLIDSNIGPLLKALESPCIQQRILHYLVLSDIQLCQVFLEFLFQYFDVVLHYNYPISKEFLAQVVPLLFGNLFDVMDSPIKSPVLTMNNFLKSNSFNDSMTPHQRAIKWISMAYQPSPNLNEVILASDIFNQYSHFLNREKIPLGLKEHEFYYVLGQVYIKSLPHKSTWEYRIPLESSEIAIDTEVFLQDTQANVSSLCWWNECQALFPCKKKLLAHLFSEHIDKVIKTGPWNCQWMNCSFSSDPGPYLKSHVCSHIISHKINKVSLYDTTTSTNDEGSSTEQKDVVPPSTTETSSSLQKEKLHGNENIPFMSPNFSEPQHENYYQEEHIESSEEYNLEGDVLLDSNPLLMNSSSSGGGGGGAETEYLNPSEDYGCFSPKTLSNSNFDEQQHFTKSPSANLKSLVQPSTNAANSNAFEDSLSKSSTQPTNKVSLLLPTFFYLKSRAIQGFQVKIDEKCLHLFMILAHITKLKTIEITKQSSEEPVSIESGSDTEDDNYDSNDDDFYKGQKKTRMEDSSLNTLSNNVKSDDHEEKLYYYYPDDEHDEKCLGKHRLSEEIVRELYFPYLENLIIYWSYDHSVINKHISIILHNLKFNSTLYHHHQANSLRKRKKPQVFSNPIHVKSL